MKCLYSAKSLQTPEQGIPRNLISPGVNDYGQIGTRSCEDATVPQFVEDLENITRIACGANHNLALSGKGKVYQWGCGRACGNLRRNVTLPEEVSLSSASVRAVCGGCWHSLLLTGLEADTPGGFGRCSVCSSATLYSSWSLQWLLVDWCG
ncbi:hypothetical protein AAFF_G00024530 [Aldrovandia affinis]|uniref:Uncharacterized protein n=1 Tax=Aldrovandia affinis TaxID=143900 RepID=A0AAD7WZN9_9TELE|nr:hypothetical protein AAFF_G00024530 [Aldrovandia affinis]